MNIRRRVYTLRLLIDGLAGRLSGARRKRDRDLATRLERRLRHARNLMSDAGGRAG
jgi:hypothetical protein